MLLQSEATRKRHYIISHWTTISVPVAVTPLYIYISNLLSDIPIAGSCIKLLISETREHTGHPLNIS